MGRYYREKDVKILWGKHAICAHPDCSVRLILEATPADDAAVIGKVCHIIAHSDIGPRADPTFPDERREEPDNLILLCGTHHDMIDVHENSYTVDQVREWKRSHDEWYKTTLSDAVLALTFKELEAIATTLVSRPSSTPASLARPTPPLRKMAHNELTAAVAYYYDIGTLRFHDVETYIADAHERDLNFANRLIGGFSAQYAELTNRGLKGDELFIALANWASGGKFAEIDRKAAGVAILTYLFHMCDVFEREPTA